MYEETLSPDRLRALLAAFKERHGAEYRLRALGYFGSYARNTATPDSSACDGDWPDVGQRLNRLPAFGRRNLSK
jgi:hypothetical protein